MLDVNFCEHGIVSFVEYKALITLTLLKIEDVLFKLRLNLQVPVPLSNIMHWSLSTDQLTDSMYDDI